MSPRGAHLRIEVPSLFGEVPVHHIDADHVLESLEFARDQSPARPRARQRNVQIVATRLRLEARTPVS